MDIHNVTGSPVSGEDFFNRVWETDKLFESLSNGNSVLLTAPRRVGKSSLMLKALERAKAQGWTTVFANVEAADSEAAFLEHLTNALRDAGVQLPALDQLVAQLGAVKKFFAGSKLAAGGVSVQIADSGPPEWQEAAQTLQEIFKAIAAKNDKLLIAIDELPIFLAALQKHDHGDSRMAIVLRWLRSMRQMFRGQIRWLLCGSIGLDTFVEQHGIVDAVNDLQVQRLGPFSMEDSIDFLVALGQSKANPLSVTKDIAEAIVDLVGWPLPYYLQIMFHAIRDLPPEDRSADYPDAADVKAAYDQLYQAGNTVYFAHWDTRLDEQLDKAKAADSRFLLNQICRRKKGLSQAKIFAAATSRKPNADPEEVERETRFLLDMLERDGYLHRSASTFAFRSFLLRDYWHHRFACSTP